MYNLVQKKAKSVIILYIVIVVVMLINLFVRRGYDDLDRTVSSIYSDRLVPAGYLFKINDHLYQKKLLLQNETVLSVSTRAQINQHNSIIAGLIKEYETTFLTLKEKQQWVGFKNELDRYTHAEWLILQHELAAINSPQLISSFDKAMQHLKELNEIQAMEGKRLQVRSRDIITESRLNAWLEASLLFLLCIIILKFAGFNEKNRAANFNTAALN
jgi:Four helix bundle sensory module for signal transduction